MARIVPIDWYYHRVGCTACRKAHAFLSDYELVVRERVDARRTRIGPSELSEVVKGAKTVLVSNGRSVARFDLSSGARGRSEMFARMVGPTGNLRAPTLRRGPLVVVGYHADSLKELVR
jgi:arsenate reductase-like glutaredoxin family protein